jgi:GNAT superfamily N-acetyltransferase
MKHPIIRPVAARDLALLDAALKALSKDLGDTHPCDVPFLKAAGFGPTPAYHALIALSDPATACGAAVFSPVLSTTLAATGLYVSDLWVCEAARGKGLGRGLLLEAAKLADALWGANFLKLAVYDGAPDARQFYDRLGFSARNSETTLFLDTDGINALKGQT